MKKIRLAAMALLVATMVWGFCVGYAYAQVLWPSELPHWAAQGSGPGDYLIGVRNVRPTENSSEWISEVYYRGELIWNWTDIGMCKGELSDPLNPYIEECMKYPGFVMWLGNDRRTEEWLVNNMTLEEFNNTLPDGIYKYNGNYYSIGKFHETKNCYAELNTPHDIYVRRHTIQIWPPTPTTASGATLATCWMILGVGYVVKRKRECNIEQ